MIRFLISLSLIYFIYRLVKKKEPRRPIKPASSPQELVQDPHCRVYFPRESAHRLKTDGKTYYFCSQECLKAFQSRKKENDPE